MDEPDAHVSPDLLPDRELLWRGSDIAGSRLGTVADDRRGVGRPAGAVCPCRAPLVGEETVSNVVRRPIDAARFGQRDRLVTITLLFAFLATLIIVSAMWWAIDQTGDSVHPAI